VTPVLRPVDEARTRLSVTHRRVRGGDLHYVFNESFEARTERLRITDGFARVTVLDPDAGERIAYDLDGEIVTIALDPAKGVVLYIER
jgi:hypothetical protein